jgi:hypothetical protein
MFAGFLGWAGGAWNWFMKSPVAQFGAFCVGLIFAWSVAVNRLKAEGAREQKRINDALNAREHAEMVTAKSEVTNELQARVTRAEAAVARQPHLRSTSELRRDAPELAALILGPDPGNGQ